MTLKHFCDKSHVSAELIRAVVRQAGGWDDFQQMAEDVAKHGANGGFHGFIYYADTCAFAKRNKAAILEYSKQLADDIGEPPYKMIGEFNCLKISEGEAAEAIHNPRSENATNALNALAWFALEEVSRAYSDLQDQA